MADFEPGTKVICLRSRWTQQQLLVAIPEEGREYVVRAFAIETLPPAGRAPLLGIRLHWVINPPISTEEGVLEPYFAIVGYDGIPNFRPVIERKTDIGLLEELLLRKDARAPELV